jgi:uncharacterized protein (TIGR01777 family)
MAADLSRSGHDITVLTRSSRASLPFRQIQWDGRTVGPWSGELDGSIVVNLAGELVDLRPTAANVERLRRSRVDATTALVEASKLCLQPVPLWLQGSTTAIYGDAGDTVVDEGGTIPEGPPQMPGVARPWEEASKGANVTRQVVLRMSLVLDRGTPVLDRLSKLVKLGLGGRISSGKQWVSWIHVRDFLRTVRFVMDTEIAGVVNVTSPNPVRNAELMSELRRHLNRPLSPPAPAPLVRLGALVMGSDPALALTGRRCVPSRLLREGFEFDLPELPAALDDLFGRPARRAQ